MFKKIFLSAICFIYLIFGLQCSKQPTQPEISKNTGILSVNIAIADNVMKKAAGAAAVDKITATIYNSLNEQIAVKEFTRQGSQGKVQFVLQPAVNMKIVVVAYENNYEKYRGETTFSLVSGKTKTININLHVSISPEKTAITATPPNIPADGSSVTTIKIIPKYPNGDNLGSGQTISFGTTLGALIDSVTYNSDDESYTQVLQSSTTSGTAEVSVIINGVSITNKVNVSFITMVSPTLSTITADSVGILADGLSTTTIILIPKDYSGYNLGSGQIVSFSTTLGTLLGSVTYISVDQSYTQILQSSTTSGTAVVSAIVNGADITNSVNVYFGSSVVFADNNLSNAIRDAIGRPAGAIYLSDLAELVKLTAKDRNITDLTGIELCTNLKELYLFGNRITDISPLSNLVTLEALDLYDNEVSDISSLSNLTGLEELFLTGNQVSDISSLSNLTNLKKLWLQYNQISNISPLSNLTNLEELSLFYNQVSDLKPLLDIQGLNRLWVSNNPLSTTSINTYIPQLIQKGVDVNY